MKILFITQWFPPVNGGASKRAERFAQYFFSRDYKLTVLTGFPSYPLGKLSKKYHWKFWQKEKYDKINVLRTYEYPVSIDAKTFKRLINWLSFMISSVIAIFFLPKHDVVLVTCPSFLSGIPGLLAKKLWKAKFYYDVSDLWPDSAIDLGLLRNELLIKLTKKIEKSYYNNAEKIFTATPGIKSHLISEGIDESKLSLCFNSTDTNLFKPQKINRIKYNYQNNDFIISYIGNHSRVYDLDTVIKSAKILQKNSKIKYLFIGEGESKTKLIQLVNKLNLSNVNFHDEINLNALSNFINLSDICLIPIKNYNVSQNAFPSKTAEYLGCGKPIIAAISGELKAYIKKYHLGLIYPSGNETKLANLILKLNQDKKLYKQASYNARQFAIKMLSNKALYKELDKIF